MHRAGHGQGFDLDLSFRVCQGRDAGRPVVPSAPAPRLENTDGSPAATNPSYALSTPGPAKIGVPNFFIDKFRIPPFLLPIYQAAGMQYGIHWEIIAGINEIETDYGRNLDAPPPARWAGCSSMPPTWKAYGVDANSDGVKDQRSTRSTRSSPPRAT